MATSQDAMSADEKLAYQSIKLFFGLLQLLGLLRLGRLTFKYNRLFANERDILIILAFVFLAIAHISLDLYDLNLVFIFFSQIAYEHGIEWLGSYYQYTNRIDSVVWSISECTSLFGICMQSISFIINLKRWWALIFQQNTPDYFTDDDDDDDIEQDPIM
jgi:hypothetical protein